METTYEEQQARITESNRRAAWQRYYYQQWLAQEAQFDRMCLMPDRTEYQVNWCAAREREKDRRAQQTQWDRENAIRQHTVDLQRQQVELEEKEHRRRVVQDVVNAYQAPYRQQPVYVAPTPSPSVNCSTMQMGGGNTSTHCY